MPVPETFQLERYFAQHEFSTRYLMCSSDIEAMTVGQLLELAGDGAQQLLLDTSLGYTESAGLPALRAAVAELYAECGADQVLLHAGAEEAIFAFARVVAAAGPTHFIVHWPCYQSLFEVARSEGARVSKWETSHEQGWALDLARLRALVADTEPGARVVIMVNMPHNPTGYVCSAAEQAEIVAVAREANALLFSDEVYRLTERGGRAALPAAADLYEGAVSLGVMSKCYGLAGLRVGWVATRDAQVLAGMASHKDYVSICCSAPSETLSLLALQQGARILERNGALLTANQAAMRAFFAEFAAVFECVDFDAGTTCFPRLTEAAGVDADQFAAELLAAKQVLVLPGSQYAPGFERHFRFSFARADMQEALALVGEFARERFGGLV